MYEIIIEPLRRLVQNVGWENLAFILKLAIDVEFLDLIFDLVLMEYAVHI